MRKEVAYFDERSRPYLAEYERVTPEGYSFRIRREKVFSLIPQTSTKGRALDVGSGPGVMIDGLLKKGYRVSAVDAAPEMVTRAREHFGNHPDVSLSVAEADALPFPDNTFDVVVAAGLFEYLADNETTLAELQRVLKERGILIATFPHRWSLSRVINRISRAVFRPLTHALKKLRGRAPYPLTHREYSLSEARALVTAADFEVVGSRFYNFKLIPYPLDTLFPRTTGFQSRLLEGLDRTFLQGLGTGFIVKAEKVSTYTTT